MNFGELKKIDLRKIWKNEEYDFSPWLAEEENLKLLSKALGLDLAFKEREADVGEYKLDILAEDLSAQDPRTVIIENQIEQSDHEHLGKVLLYAAGFDADIAIWIAKEFREPHLRAINWLNENMGENKAFFAVQIEVLQIGDSQLAPKFTVVCKPNSWSKTVKNQAKDNERSAKLLEFWTKFHEYLEKKKSTITPYAPSTDHWDSVSIGTAKAHLSFTARKNGPMGCEIYIPNDKAFYKKLEGHKDEIEKSIGLKLDWQPLEDRKACRIIIYNDDFDLFDTTSWEKSFAWLDDMGHRFLKAFKPYIK